MDASANIRKAPQEYFDLDEKQQLADFFGYRNMTAVNQKFEECPCAVIAAEEFGMQYFGDLWPTGMKKH